MGYARPYQYANRHGRTLVKMAEGASLFRPTLAFEIFKSYNRNYIVSNAVFVDETKIETCEILEYFMFTRL
jgi:hypothetical protein